MRPTETDELIEQIKQKDEGAFRELMSVYQNKIYVFAFRMLCNEEDANDAVQDTFINVWRGIFKYQHDYSFNTWIYRIAANCCYDMLRKRKRMPDIIAGIDTEEILALSHRGNIEQALSNKHIGAVIHMLTHKLPHKQKAVFILKELEGLEIAEISAITQLSPKKIKSNLYVARIRMKILLNKFSNNEPY